MSAPGGGGERLMLMHLTGMHIELSSHKPCTLSELERLGIPSLTGTASGGGEVHPVVFLRTG